LENKNFAKALEIDAMLAIRFGNDNSGIDYKQSYLSVVEYCEKTHVLNAPKVNGVPPGRLISPKQADHLRKEIRQFKL
jgi:hypothetical protein